MLGKAALPPWKYLMILALLLIRSAEVRTCRGDGMILREFRAVRTWSSRWPLQQSQLPQAA